MLFLLLQHLHYDEMNELALDGKEVGDQAKVALKVSFFSLPFCTRT